LEIIHRIPSNDALRPHVKNILNLMFHLLEVENEDNVLVCLRIIIELHKQFRPPFQPEIQQFLQFVKTMYRELVAMMVLFLCHIIRKTKDFGFFIPEDAF
jgi:transformation/transcription domain-associated protein